MAVEPLEAPACGLQLEKEVESITLLDRKMHIVK